ncbi:MAG: hypothetical protein Q8P76_04415 [bacterium]|nr:hypothetical protein [bacterium]
MAKPAKRMFKASPKLVPLSGDMPLLSVYVFSKNKRSAVRDLLRALRPLWGKRLCLSVADVSAVSRKDLTQTPR